jgi:hypothetical protein
MVESMPSWSASSTPPDPVALPPEAGRATDEVSSIERARRLLVQVLKGRQLGDASRRDDPLPRSDK